MIDDPLNRTKVKRGEELPQAELTEDDVRNIRALAQHREDLRRQADDLCRQAAELRRQASTLTTCKLAEKFDRHRNTIDRIVQGYLWSHVA